MLLFEDDTRIDPIDLITITKDEYVDLLTDAGKWQMIREHFYGTTEVKYAEWNKGYYLSASGEEFLKAMEILDRQRLKEFKDAGIDKIRE